MFINCGLSKVASRPAKGSSHLLPSCQSATKASSRIYCPCEFLLYFQYFYCIDALKTTFAIKILIMDPCSNVTLTCVFSFSFTDAPGFRLKDTFPPPSLTLHQRPEKKLPCRRTWLYLRLTCLPYVISKPLSARR